METFYGLSFALFVDFVTSPPDALNVGSNQVMCESWKTRLKSDIALMRRGKSEDVLITHWSWLHFMPNWIDFNFFLLVKFKSNSAWLLNISRNEFVSDGNGKASATVACDWVICQYSKCLTWKHLCRSTVHLSICNVTITSWWKRVITFRLSLSIFDDEMISSLPSTGLIFCSSFPQKSVWKIKVEPAALIDWMLCHFSQNVSMNSGSLGGYFLCWSCANANSKLSWSRNARVI